MFLRPGLRPGDLRREARYTELAAWAGVRPPLTCGTVEVDGRPVLDEFFADP